MSTVHVVLARRARDKTRPDGMPLSVPVASDTVSLSGTSTQSSLVAGPADRQFWSVTGHNACYVAFGLNPVAAADAGWYIPAGGTREFAVTETGEKIAVVNHA